MPRILLVKTSSLGDVVHNLPVASDIGAAIPEVEIDWVVEEAYAPIPALHPRVTRVIPVAVRRWRRNLLERRTRAELKSFAHELRARRYDAIIDTQGLFKSALIARAAHGPCYGMDWRSAGEPLAIFYDRAFDIPREQNAVERNRALAARALRYTCPAAVRYELTPARVPHERQASPDYAVLIHATSARRKLWPEERWIALGKVLAGRGTAAVLPWGTEEERRRSERIAAAVPGAISPARSPLDRVAQLLAGSRCTVGVDTGLTHLAGALGVPTVGVYSATDPAATGLYGCARALNVGGIGAAPGVADVLRGLERLIS